MTSASQILRVREGVTEEERRGLTDKLTKLLGHVPSEAEIIHYAALSNLANTVFKSVNNSCYCKDDSICWYCSYEPDLQNRTEPFFGEDPERENWGDFRDKEIK